VCCAAAAAPSAAARSFPSGHAANSMSVAWFTTLYVIWSLYLRSDAPYPSE
jgi:membrane-associated phospholipid phosphatase